MKIILESQRLIFREFTLDDAALLFELNKDDEVRRYVHEPAPTLDSTRTALKEIILPQYKLYNHGRWALHLKSTNEFIGWCGLKFIAEQNEIDLGYRFMKKYWGNGYATESARSAVKYGFEQLLMKKIVARAHVENIASLKVIEKCGLHFLYEEIYHGDLVKTFEITAAEYFVK
jgi:[ribosomal protein S5]-alanine N-acetyltransferase